MRSFLEWYDREVAPGACKRAIESLSPDESALFDVSRGDLGVLASRWYDARLVHRILDRMLVTLDDQARWDLARAGGDAIASSMQRGAHRVVFNWFITPGRYAKIVDWAWRLNYSDGTVTTTVLAPNRHQGVVSGWGGHHPFLCMVNVAIKRAIYEAMGCKRVRIESRSCVDALGDECGSIVAWDGDDEMP